MNVRALSFVVAGWISLSLLSSADAQSTGILLQHALDSLHGSPERSAPGIPESTFQRDDDATAFYTAFNENLAPAATSGLGAVATFDLDTGYTLSISSDYVVSWDRVNFDIETGDGGAMNFAVRPGVDHFTADLLNSGLRPAISPDSFGEIVPTNASAKAPVENRTYTWSAKDDGAQVSVDHVAIANIVIAAASLGLLGGGIALLVLARRRQAA
jgi:hypothetical protein